MVLTQLDVIRPATEKSTKPLEHDQLIAAKHAYVYLTPNNTCTTCRSQNNGLQIVCIFQSNVLRDKNRF